MADQTGWGGFLGAGADALANYYGNRSATNDLVGGNQNAINTQTGIQGQLTGIYGTQRGLGAGADVSLAQQLGLIGGQPDFSPYANSPGYQFALQQGNQAINRQASANGSLYTPNTLAALSQYNTGYASQHYNDYISQLMQAAGLGAQGNAGLASGIYNTGANISQAQQNQGANRAGGAANQSGITSNLISKVPWGSVANSVGNWWNGSSNTGSSDYIGNTSYTGGGGDPSAWYQGNGDNSGDPSQMDQYQGGTTSYWGDDSNP